MNAATDKPLPAADASAITRREAVKRTALLLGAALSPSILAGVLHAEAARPVPGAKPVHLDAGQFETAAAIADRILPRTDTPGAIDVGVPAFLDTMYGRFLSENERRVFAAGLTEVDTTSRKLHRAAFARLSPEQEDALLRGLAEASQAKKKTFFHLMKELTLTGYFTSEPVGKKVLHYDPVPGPFRGCLPLSEVGNASWTR